MNLDRPPRKAAEKNQFITTSKRSKIVSESISKSKISTTGILGSSNNSSNVSFVKWAEDNPVWGGLPRSFRENKPGEPFKNPVGETPILVRKKGVDGYGCCSCGMYVKYVDGCQHRCGNTGEVVHAWCTTTDQPEYGDSLSFDKIWCKTCFFPWGTAIRNQHLIDEINAREKSKKEAVESELEPIFSNEEVEAISNGPKIDPPIIVINEINDNTAMESPCNFTLPYQAIEEDANIEENKELEIINPKDPVKKRLLTEIIQCASGPWSDHNEIEAMVKALPEDLIWEQLHSFFCLLAVNEVSTEESK